MQREMIKNLQKGLKFWINAKKEEFKNPERIRYE